MLKVQIKQNQLDFQSIIETHGIRRKKLNNLKRSGTKYSYFAQVVNMKNAKEYDYIFWNVKDGEAFKKKILYVWVIFMKQVKKDTILIGI